VIADRGYDFDALRRRLLRQGTELIVPDCRGRIRRPYQDKRKYVATGDAGKWNGPMHGCRIFVASKSVTTAS
jgi:hypothetical protein